MTQPQPRTIALTEWDRVTLSYDSEPNAGPLTQDRVRSIPIEALKGKVELNARLDGLEIQTSSFVGQLDLGPLRLAIRPKIDGMPLATLLRYAYGLRDLSTHGEAQAPTAEWGFQDLLVSLLVAESEELVHRGLAKSYARLEGRLESPRGRLDLDALVRDGGLQEARMPCRYFERRSDGVLNQVLRAGLELAATITNDHDLRRATHRLAAWFSAVRRLPTLDVAQLRKADEAVTRLTDAYVPALTLIRLLVGMRGVDFDTGEESRIPGFLFDMNAFYQRLLSRFLHKNLVGQRIEDEHRLRSVFSYALGANPRRRHPPTPRPDFALFDRLGLQGFLDAKYRDAWTLDIPASWLYQLSIYALVSPKRTAVLLYATLDDASADERIDLRHPLPSADEQATVGVILRPVHLGRLADLVDPRQANALIEKRQAYARSLTRLAVQKGTAIAA